MGKNKSKKKPKTELSVTTSVLRKLDNMLKKEKGHHGKETKGNA